MTLISVLLSLLLDRNVHLHRDSSVQSWFGRCQEFIAARLPGTRAGMGSLLLVTLPPVVIIGVAQWLLEDWLFGIVGLVFAIAVLLFTLGPLDIADSVDEYIDAARAGDEERAAYYFQHVTGEMPPGSSSDEGRRMISTLFYQVHDHLFATLFWFCVLGPLGAVFYRMMVEAALRPGVALVARPQLQRAARHALGILGWIPARLLALGFAMTGSFDSAVRAARDHGDAFPGLLESNQQFLQAVGTASMRSRDEADRADGERRSRDRVDTLAQARSLVIRAGIFWLALLALMTLAGWLG